MIQFIEPLPSNEEEGYIARQTDTYCWERFMKYAVEMGSGVMIYIPSFIKNGLGIRKLMGGGGGGWLYPNKKTKNPCLPQKPIFIF
jgi:hypothetical protein